MLVALSAMTMSGVAMATKKAQETEKVMGRLKPLLNSGKKSNEIKKLKQEAKEKTKTINS